MLCLYAVFIYTFIALFPEMLTRQELLNLVLRDQNVDQNQLRLQYSDQLISMISDHYDEISCNFMTSDLLISNYFRYRFASNAPNQTLNYYPLILGEDNSFIDYVEAIIHEYYRHDSVYINFSPCLILRDAQQQITFLYASNNFYCWETSHLIHNDASKTRFFEKLRNFNLQNYVDTQQSILSGKYDGVVLEILSLTLFATRAPQIIFGATTILDKSISSKKSDSHHTPKNKKILRNDCIFQALSQFLSLTKRKIEIIKKNRQKTNQKTAKKLKNYFFKWLTKSKCLQKKHDNISNIFTSAGITERGLLLIEDCFQVKLDIWEVFKKPYKKITAKKIYSIEKRQISGYKRIRKSEGPYQNLINLSQSTPDPRRPLIKHIEPILSSYFLTKKECEKCSKIFFRSTYYKSHLLKCYSAQKDTFIPSKPILKSFDFDIDIPRLFSNYTIKKKEFFFIISLQKNENKFISSIFLYDEGKMDFLTFQDSSLLNLCSQIIIFCSYISKPYKEINLQRNIALLANATESLSRSSSSNLQYATRELKKFLSHTVVFFTSPAEQRHLVSKSLKTLISAHSKANPNETFCFTSKTGKFKSVLLTGPKSGLNFISLNDLLPTIPFKGEQPFSDYCFLLLKAFKDIKTFLGIDLLYGNYTSAPGFSKSFFENNMGVSASYSFLSPSILLKKELDTACRFGHLQAYKCIIGKDFNMKSFVQLDFSKMYLSILQNLDSSLFLGQSIHLKKEGILFKQQKKYLPATSFASLLFIALQLCTQGEFQYASVSHENRFQHYSMDLVIHLPKPNTHQQREFFKYAYQYHGCFFHACMKPCHLQNTPTNHSKYCNTCSTAKVQARSLHRPKLWKLPKDHTYNSFHPKKKVTYKEINQKSLKNDEIIKNSNQYDSYVTISECDVIIYWDLPVYRFLEAFKFPFQLSSIHYKTLGALFSKAHSHAFPLLNEKNITMGKIIQYIKLNKIRGLLTVSGKIGQRGESILGNFQVFSSKTKEGKMQNSNEIKSSLITSEFLRFLLQNNVQGSIPDFILLSIKNIFLFPNIKKNPFKRTCTYLKDILNTQKTNTPLISTLKIVANSYCGILAYQKNKNGATHILRHSEIQSLSQLNNLVATELLNSEYFISHFKTNVAYHNFSHINFAIVQKARLEFIKFYLLLASYLNIHFKGSNTDGLLITSTIPYKDNSISLPQVLQLDTFLKSNLPLSSLREYLQFKKNYFFTTSVCERHEELYIQSLFNSIQFNPQNCCLTSVSNTIFPYKVKFEAMGNSGAVYGINKSILIDHTSGQSIIKCSGNQHNQFKSLFTTSQSDIESNIKQVFYSS